MELNLKSRTITFTEKELELIAEVSRIDAAELAKLIMASDIVAASTDMGLDPAAVISAAIASADGIAALAEGDGRAALDAALGETGLEGFGTGLPQSGTPDFGGQDGLFDGKDGSLFDGGGDNTSHGIKLFDDDGGTKDTPEGWQDGTGDPNFQTAKPGDIVYDSNGNEAGVMTEFGIDLFLDGEDTDGDGKADTAVDSNGVIYLTPENGHLPDADDDPEPTNGGDGTGGDDGGDGTDTGGDGTDTGGTDTGGDSTPAGNGDDGSDDDDDPAPDTGEGDTAVTGSGTDGTTQPGEAGGAGDPIDSFDFTDDDGTTQPGFNDYATPINVDPDSLDPGYGTTQPGFDDYGGGGIIVIHEPGYGLTQPDLNTASVMEPIDLALM